MAAGLTRGSVLGWLVQGLALWGNGNTLTQASTRRVLLLRGESTRISCSHATMGDAQKGGSSDVDYLKAAAMHPDGSNSVLAGFTFGNWSTESSGNTDFMAVNLDADGSVLWEWQDGTEGDDEIYAAVIAEDGSVVLAGHTSGGYDSSNNAGFDDFVAIKLDSQGHFLWSWQSGSVEAEFVKGIAMNEDGSVVLVGYASNYETSSTTTSSGRTDCVAIKLDADGIVQWTWQGGGSISDFCYGATPVGDGGVVMVGHTYSDWGDVNAGSLDFAAVKLNANGEDLWVWQDDLNLGRYTAASGVDRCSLALNRDVGFHDGVLQGGTEYDDLLFTVVASEDGSVVMAGQTSGDFGSINAGSNDFTAIKLDANGTMVWMWQEGSDSEDHIEGAAVLERGSVILVGYTAGKWSGTSSGEDDFAAVELDANGSVLWRWQNGTDEDDHLQAVATDGTTGILLAGYTSGSWNGFSSGDSDFVAMLLDANSTSPPTPSSTTERPATATPAITPVQSDYPVSSSPASSDSPVSGTPSPNTSLEGGKRSFSPTVSAEFPSTTATVAYPAFGTPTESSQSASDTPSPRKPSTARIPSPSPVVYTGHPSSTAINVGTVYPIDETPTPSGPPASSTPPTSAAPEAETQRPSPVVSAGSPSFTVIISGVLGAAMVVIMIILAECLRRRLKKRENKKRNLHTIAPTVCPGSKTTSVDSDGEATASTNHSRSTSVGISTAEAVMEAATTVARSSSIPGVSEAATLVSLLVKLVVDHSDNDGAVDCRVRWCRSIVAMLESASELFGKGDDGAIGDAELYLLEDVHDSVSDLVGIMQTYTSKVSLSKLFLSSLFKHRQEVAEAAIEKAISRLQLGLQVQAGHDLASVGRNIRKGFQDIEMATVERGRSLEGSTVKFPKQAMAESRRRKREQRLQKLEIPEHELTLTDVLLGKGGFGEVYLADYSGVNAAAKVLNIDVDQLHQSTSHKDNAVSGGKDEVQDLDLQRNQHKFFLRELQAMIRLRSPYIVHVYGAIAARKDRFIIVMELMPGGDLRTLLREARGSLPEERKRGIMKDVCFGMTYLHSMGAIHGDLKSANVLLSSAGMAKIADFGTARWTHAASTGLAQTLTTTKNSNSAHMSIPWAAPEVLDDELLSFKSDVYSFGIIAWEIVSGKMPWTNLNARSIFRRVVLAGERPEIPKGTAVEVEEMLHLSWHENPERRPNFADIIEIMTSWTT